MVFKLPNAYRVLLRPVHPKPWSSAFQRDLGRSSALLDKCHQQEGAKAFPKQVLPFWPGVLCVKGPDWQTGGRRRDAPSHVSRMSDGTAVMPERETHGAASVGTLQLICTLCDRI